MNIPVQMRYVGVVMTILLGILAAVGIRFFSTVHTGPTIDLSAALGKENVIDVLILGSGPAGSLAAVYAGRAHRYTWVLDGNEPGGLLTKTTLVENWPGELSIMGPDIINHLKLQAKHHGAHFLADTVSEVDFSTYPYVVKTEEGRVLNALSVIIATGATPKKLGIPGEERYWGMGVTTCAVCDAPFYKGLDVVVIGGGDSAVEEALQLASYARSITIMVRGAAMRAAPSMQARLAGYSNIKILYNTALTEIVGNQNGVTAIEVQDTVSGIAHQQPISGVFLAIGHVPNTEFLDHQVALEDSGHIKTFDRTQRTSVPGVFVAGDVADTLYRQAGVAAGDGIKAALDADMFLRDHGYNEALARALEDHRFWAYTDDQAQYVPTLETVEAFDKAIQEHPGIVVIDFYAHYCPLCMQMVPVFGVVAQQYADRANFFKVDIEQALELSLHLHVPKVPALLVFRNGKLIARYSTTMTKSELRILIDELLMAP
jgi:thioredoxin reductase (NADPH)